jgi:small subunit ribosomal protein S21
MADRLIFACQRIESGVGRSHQRTPHPCGAFVVARNAVCLFLWERFAARSKTGQEQRRHMQIIVRDNNVDQALRALKKKLQREGVYREMKLRRHYEKPSEKRARERAAAVRRARKMERKRMERDGVR